MMGSARQVGDLPEVARMRREAPELLTVHEAAEHFRVQEPTIQRWCREGRLQAVRVGKSWRIPRPDHNIPPMDTARRTPDAYRNGALDRIALGSRARGQHRLVVAETADHAEALLGRLQSRAVARNVVAVRLRLGRADHWAESDEVVLAPDLEPGETRELALAWKRFLNPLSHHERVLCLMRQDTSPAFANGEALVRWETHISASVVGGPFTVICVYDDASFQRLPIDVRTRVIAEHSAMGLESENSQVLLSRA